MNINKKTVESILERAYDAGQSGCADFREATIQELLVECRPQNGFRFYTLYEIQKFTQGRRILHPVRGDGEVVLNENCYGVKFRSGFVPFSAEHAEFWSYPLCDMSAPRDYYA